jgi:hypothetical protein
LQGQHAELLPEFLRELARSGRRVPEDLLVALLEAGKRSDGLAELFLPVLAERGKWLARQNPDWHSLSPVGEEAAVWQTGTPGQRKAFLRRQRERDPAAARSLLTAVWDQESDKQRAEFLEQFVYGLSEADEPFLQNLQAQANRQAWARLPQKLLSRLPQSAYTQRAVAQTLPVLELRPGSLLRKEALVSELDAHALAEKVQLIPPSSWCRKFGKSAAELIALAKASKLKTGLLEAWVVAAAHFKEVDWAAALILEIPSHTKANELWQLLSSERKQAALIHLLRNHPNLAYDQPAAPYLLTCRFAWDLPLSETVLQVLGDYLRRDALAQAWAWRSLLSVTAAHLSAAYLPTALAEVGAALKPNAESFSTVNEFLTLLQFRYDMLQELHQ